MSEEARDMRDMTDWMAVLDRLAESLNRSPESPPAPLPEVSAAYPPLQAIDGHLARMQAGMGQAEQNAAEAERELAALLDPLQQWLERMRVSREKLVQAAQG